MESNALKFIKYLLSLKKKKKKNDKTLDVSRTSLTDV